MSTTAAMGVRRGVFLPRPLARPSNDAASPALLEFQSPTASFLARPLPASGRATIWIVAAAVGAAITAMSLCAVDRVVTVPGKVVAQTPNIVVQPLEASIVRGISVREGQVVHAGDLLARLDPTFAAAEATASEAQLASLQSEVGRLEAEIQGRAYRSDGSTPSQLQAMIYAQRRAEQTARFETYRQKIDSARSRVAQTQSDVTGYAEQLRTATTKETMRRELERLQVGSKLNRAFYRASISMDEMKLHHLPAGFHMTPGMPVTVDIKVGQRTVMAYLLSRVVPTLSEGMREP